MNGRTKSLLYFAFGIYAILISWYFNHSFFWLIVHYLLWPFYLIYEILNGHLSHGMWKTIPLSYFR